MLGPVLSFRGMRTKNTSPQGACSPGKATPGRWGPMVHAEVLPSTAEVWILALLIDWLFELQNVSLPLHASVCLSAKWMATAVLTVFV